MAKWSKTLSGEALKEVISQIVWSYWPYWGAPIVSATLFYMNGYPSGVIFMVALSAFALIAMALNNVSQWLAAKSAAGKVDYLGP
jgi:hypothetical protein